MFGQTNTNQAYYQAPPHRFPSSWPIQQGQGWQNTVRNQNYYYSLYGNQGWQAYGQMNQSQQYPYGHMNAGQYPPTQGEVPFAQEQPYPVESILQNPLQPKKNQGGTNPYMGYMNPYMHPYPKPGIGGNRPPSGISSFMNSFKQQDGSLDFNKMIDTAGQMMNAVNQVSGLVKGLGGIFKV
ncbi:YppG family protein [Robertmurraya sp. DFI.2.37]|uniref:YppG family protein n=1 Tax=Robertmurraya sp. DFI.2.37 TaxID=3031819 RepID=UPI0012465C99|nr:YppG family protein [Robertmurraya sp. DFI.2.37]MDF1507766.1 YppG family protein [Robertmurraya sp. DFI.2.37]